MSEQPPITGFGFQPHTVVTVNVDTLVEKVEQMYAAWTAKHGEDVPVPDARDVRAALSDLAARARDLDHLKSEFNYESWRGDHLVYESEWEAFDRWQRGEGDRLARRVAELEQDNADLVRDTDQNWRNWKAADARVAELEAEREEWLRVTDIPPLFSQATPHMTDEIRRMRLKVLAGDGVRRSRPNKHATGYEAGDGGGA